MSTPVPGVRTYCMVAAALLGLLGLTIAAAYINLGPLNTIVAMSISIAKGALILLIFMHVRYSGRLIWVFAGVGVCWLGIMLVLAMSDYLSRGWR